MSTHRPTVFPPAQESDAPFARLPVTFVGSFPDPTRPLEPALPEVALLGRSNVGKSSLLNALFGRSLARVSRTPGRTGQVNVYRLPTLYLLDLPGYGFARASQQERARFERLLRGVVEHRPSLSGVLWLVDIRRDLTEQDHGFQALLAARRLPVLVALTKSDKLPFGQRRRRLRALMDQLSIGEDQVQLTSGVTGEGLAELGESLMAAASGATEEPS
jgi:GTP-binding protein